MNDTDRPWKGKTGGGHFGQKSLIFLFKFLNVRVGYFFAAFAIPFYMLFGRESYLAIYRFFNQRIGCGKFTSFIKTCKNYFTFSQIIVDRFSVLANGKSKFYVTITGQEFFEDYIYSEKGFIMASSHVGNFEICGYLLHQDVKKINSLIYGGEAPVFQSYREKQLEKNNVKSIPVTDDLSHLFIINEALDKGEIISMPCDRLIGSNKFLKCEFLGKETSFPLGAFRLSALKEVDILSVFVIKLSASHYHIFLKPIITDGIPNESMKSKSERLAFLYVNQLETIVKKYPEQWFNYYDFWNN